MRSDSAGVNFSNEKNADFKGFDKKPGSNSAPKVVLVGNPNVGKSLIFNYLSGMYVEVSNFPGTTVSVSSGKYKSFEIYDTPGIYGVSSFNDEERVARDIIIEADIVLNVVNSLHLERDLFLTRQLIEMGKKVSIILNFADEVKRKKIVIDSKRLSKILDVEVVETSAINKSGFENLENAIINARQGAQPGEVSDVLNQDILSKSGREIALLVAEGDEQVAEKYGYVCGTADEREKIYIDRRNSVNAIISEVEYENSSKGRFFNLLGSYSLNPLTGIPILALILVMLYYLIGDFVAQQVVDVTENKIGKGVFEFYTKSFISEFTPVDIEVTKFDDEGETIDEKTFAFPDNLLSHPETKTLFDNYIKDGENEVNFDFKNPIARLFFGEFGVITMTVTYLIFLLLPLVIAFYIVMAFLEDSGYLPRLATMMDKSLSRIGLNGRAVIPIMLGFGCVTMATITTRILGSEREKTIATAILQFVIPCSAQLAVIAVLVGKAGIGAFAVYGVVIFTVMITISTILNKFLPGQSTPLLIDLPVMRLPRPANVIKKTYFRSVGFMKEASVWFFVGALFVGILEITGLLVAFQNLLAPVTTLWLKLPKEAATAFVMGTVRRDFGAAGLFDLELSAMQIAVALITITLFVPCIASFMVMLKERGLKEGITIWLSAWVLAFFVGGLTALFVL